LTKGKTRPLAWEILGIAAVSLLISLALFWILSHGAIAVAENYCFEKDIVMTEFDWIDMDRWIFTGSAIVSAFSFSLLLLAQLADRMTYIRKLTEGIHRLTREEEDISVPLEGNNELTVLAQAINRMSQTRRELREKEQTLAREKEQLIRTLSHDIRTPLTSILSYSEYLAARDDLPREEQTRHLALIRRKGEQIRDLTDILLEGSRRSPEYFEDAGLLFRQLAAEFEELLEDDFRVQTELSGCGSFSGSFDVGEMRRIFDNLISNVQKYADPAAPVVLELRKTEEKLIIRQTNAVRPEPRQQESYTLGIRSIRRIAQYYGGSVETRQEDGRFAVTVTLL